ncbi:CarD family transcriptional regulator [Fredinandcohnia sp. 179-A 10B2 NHS]|uniref:CarD family transcriptional regulator n=1 Tax=Fredinandcohnia sp. 179-A 10B2 NHS TaxID=3235176 RepID=UPI0039A267AA
MFNVGDLIIYSSIGICKIDDICEKTFAGITRNYYVMHPIEDENLVIQNPVDNDQIRMVGMIQPEEAEEIIKTFSAPGIQWIEKGHDRLRGFSDIVKTGDRKEIAKIINTFMSKKIELERNEKKLSEGDRKLLFHLQSILFKGLAISLSTTQEEIEKQITNIVNKRVKCN